MSSATEPAAPSLKQLALGDLEQEVSITRRVLERVPDEHLAWKPHDRSMALGSLALHLANLPHWQLRILQSDEFDIGQPLPRQEPPASRAEILAAFDERVSRVREALAATDDAALAQPWTLRRGEQVVMRVPRVGAIRTMGLSHAAHHRGQLSVYLRLLDVPVPSIYGPSADEQ